MNNIYNIKAKGNRIKVILFMLVALFGTSCKKDIYKQIQKGEDKPLAITLSKSAVELHETDFA